jgi:hypothetical protein
VSHEKRCERLEYEDSVIEVVNAMQEPYGLGIDRLNQRLLDERMQSGRLSAAPTKEQTSAEQLTA